MIKYLPMSEHFRDTALCIWNQAERFLSNHPTMGRVLSDINASPERQEALATLVDEFDDVCRVLNTYLIQHESDESDHGFYKNIIELAKVLPRPTIPLLSQLRSPEEVQKSKVATRFAHAVKHSLRDIGNLVEDDGLFPVSIAPSSDVFIFNSLVYGYASFLGHLYGYSESRAHAISHSFAKAAQEVIFDCNYSPLLYYSLESMIATRDSFGDNVREELEIFAKMPVRAQEQLDNLPSPEEREQLTLSMATALRQALDQDRIRIIDMRHRTKTPESIQQKVVRGGGADIARPLLDIHGIRVIVPHGYVVRTTNILYNIFPTPRITRDGRETDRYWEDVQELPNGEKKLVYQARHKNVVIFDSRGNVQFGEVQVMTPEAYEAAIASREAYEKKKGRNN